MAKGNEESVTVKDVVAVLNDNSDGEEIQLTVDLWSNYLSLVRHYQGS